MPASKVWFTDMRAKTESLPAKLRRLMKAAGFEQLDLDSKFVAVKMHFGEPGNLATFDKIIQVLTRVNLLTSINK